MATAKKTATAQDTEQEKATKATSRKKTTAKKKAVDVAEVAQDAVIDMDLRVVLHAVRRKKLTIKRTLLHNQQREHVVRAQPKPRLKLVTM